MQFSHHAICQDLKATSFDPPRTCGACFRWCAYVAGCSETPNGGNETDKPTLCISRWVAELDWDTDKPGLSIQRRDHLFVGKTRVAVSYCVPLGHVKRIELR
jgi:hypothetical protein